MSSDCYSKKSSNYFSTGLLTSKILLCHQFMELTDVTYKDFQADKWTFGLMGLFFKYPK